MAKEFDQSQHVKAIIPQNIDLVLGIDTDKRVDLSSLKKWVPLPPPSIETREVVFQRTPVLQLDPQTSREWIKEFKKSGKTRVFEYKGEEDFEQIENDARDYDIVIANKLSGKATDPFSTVKKLFQRITPNGILFASGILLENLTMGKMLEHWSNLGYEFGHATEWAGKDLSSNGYIVLNIALRKTTEDVSVPQPADSLIKTYDRSYNNVQYKPEFTKA